MDIGDWRDSPPERVSDNSAPRQFLSPTVVGVLGTLLLHAMVIQSLPFGRGPLTKLVETRETAFALTKSQSDSETSLVLINLSSSANAQPPAGQVTLSSLPDLSKGKVKWPINLDPPALLETLALNADQSSKSVNDRGDGAERARLFGIYSGQIQARIDRAWQRPRTPVNEAISNADKVVEGESFQCEAQIVQDVRGNVQEILLPRCNGSPAWQRSLVLAIQQASPLPAPPSPKVFSSSITLSFVGLVYNLGSSDDGYEIQARSVAQQ